MKEQLEYFRKSNILGVLTLGMFLFTNTLNAQNFVKRYVDNIVNNKGDLHQPQLIVNPTLAFAPETSWEIGMSALYVYFANQDTTNRLSKIKGFTFVTLENQYGFWFDHAIYSDQNRWFFHGRTRIQSYPLYYHGIGIDTPIEYIARIDANQILIKERVFRKLKNDIYVGLEFDYQRLDGIDFVLADPENTNFELPLGHDGSTNIGIGLGLIQENRHNVLNVRKGLYSELNFVHYNTAWGSTYKFTSVLSDTRVYRPMSKNNVLAVQLLGQFNFGDIPFSQLAMMGGESIMRGYYYGRYRDRHQLAAQVEYRLLPIPLNFTERLGLAFFVGAGSIFNQVDNLNISNFVVSGGAGVRFLIFPKKDIWTRIDFAVTEEGSGFYFFIGESF